MSTTQDQEFCMIVGPVHPNLHCPDEVAQELYKGVKNCPHAAYAGFSRESNSFEHQFIFASPGNHTLKEFIQFVRYYWNSFADRAVITDGNVVFQTIATKDSEDWLLPERHLQDHDEAVYAHARELRTGISRAQYRKAGIEQLLDYCVKSVVRSAFSRT